jgi:hypothetical protein
LLAVDRGVLEDAAWLLDDETRNVANSARAALFSLLAVSDVD